MKRRFIVGIFGVLAITFVAYTGSSIAQKEMGGRQSGHFGNCLYALRRGSGHSPLSVDSPEARCRPGGGPCCKCSSSRVVTEKERPFKDVIAFHPPCVAFAQKLPHPPLMDNNGLDWSDPGLQAVRAVGKATRNRASSCGKTYSLAKWQGYCYDNGTTLKYEKKEGFREPGAERKYESGTIHGD